MKKFILACVVIGAVMVFGAPTARAADTWFDMQNCEMCKPMAAESGLMEHLHWSTYPVATGMVYVTTVDKGFEEPYKKAGQGMMAVQQRLGKGEKVYLCNHCQSFGALMAAGAKVDNLNTNAGDVMVMSSTDPAEIEKIHQHAGKTIQAMKEMGAAEK